jgi:hypothetical protein
MLQPTLLKFEDDRLESVMQDHSYLDTTRDVLHETNGLWFNDEFYVVSRRQK